MLSLKNWRRKCLFTILYESPRGSLAFSALLAKAVFETLGGIGWRDAFYSSNPVSWSCCLVTWSSSILSLSLFHLLLQSSYGEKLCQSTRALVWFTSVIVYTLFDWGVLLIMFSPYDRTFFEHEAGMLQWNMQLARCKSIFSIFYHHRLFNKIDFTGRSILWPVIYKYMWARNLRTVDK